MGRVERIRLSDDVSGALPSGRVRGARLGGKRFAFRARAFAISSSLVLGGAVVSRDRSSRVAAAATSSMADSNAASFTFDGLLKPLSFRTNCSEAARISPSVTGGSKL